MNRRCLRRLTWCAVIGALGGGILLRLTAPDHIGEGLLLGMLLGAAFCAIHMLFGCMTSNGGDECPVAQNGTWFGHLCDRHPVAGMLLFAAYTLALFVIVRIVFIAFGWCLCEAWSWIVDAVRVLTG